MNALTWAGALCAALIAVATVVRWAIHRAIHAGRWIAAFVRLPGVVDRLTDAVTELAHVVRILADERPSQPEPTLEHL